MAHEWQVTDEFSQRLGCGAVTALVLPLWFVVMWLALRANVLALWLTTALGLVAVVGGAVGFARIRALPRRIELDVDAGELRFIARRGTSTRPAAALTAVHIGSSVGIAPVRLTFAGAPPVRVPRELDDFDGFVAALRGVAASLAVTDRSAP